MNNQVKQEAEKLKELYKTSSKALEDWPQSDSVSCCDDKTFAELLKDLSELDLEAAVHGLQRQIDIELLLVKNFERLRIINSDCPDTNSKLISSQAKVARLRSRLLRCLSKQLNKKGHKGCVLPSWHSRIENGQETTAAASSHTKTQEQSKTGTEDVRDGSYENQIARSMSTASSTSKNSEELEQVPMSDEELEQLHWVEPISLSSEPSKNKDIEGKSSPEIVVNVKECPKEKDNPQANLQSGKELSEEGTGLKKIQETLEKNLHVKSHEDKQTVAPALTSPPPKPPPYSPQGKKDKTFQMIPEEQSADLLEGGDAPDGCIITEQPQMQDWDPTLLLQDLFGDNKDNETSEDATPAPAPAQGPSSTGLVRMSGYMEKLPSSYKQKKSSVFKGWKKRHFKAFDGKLFYFEDHRNHEPLGLVDLKGCSVIISGGRILELIDSEGKAAFKVRCATPTEAEDWKEALEEEAKSQATEDVENVDASPESLVIIIDLGSSSVKAGFASEEVWPQVVFPCVCAELKDDESDRVYGIAALVPERRKKSILRFPLRRSLKIDKLKYSTSSLTGVLEHIFSVLKVDPSKHKVIMTLPQHTSINEKGELVEILLGFFGVEACYLQEQSILAMYSYSAVSGIVVDIGDHIDVIPVVEGCVIEAGASRLPYGGRQVTDMLARLLTENGHRFFSEVESFITRYVKEKACYVSEKAISNDEDLPSHAIDVMLDKYKIPDGTKKVTFDTARYRCTEGLFEPHVWGKDHPGIHELTYKAINACSIDVRKQMCRSIYLSGGGSMLPGFPERLQTEVSALLPPHNTVQVHAGTDRQNAAFIGASVVARLPLFEELCITQDEWNDIGSDALEKWQNL